MLSSGYTHVVLANIAKQGGSHARTSSPSPWLGPRLPRQDREYCAYRGADLVTPPAQSPRDSIEATWRAKHAPMPQKMRAEQSTGILFTE